MEVKAAKNSRSFRSALFRGKSVSGNTKWVSSWAINFPSRVFCWPWAIGLLVMLNPAFVLLKPQRGLNLGLLHTLHALLVKCKKINYKDNNSYATRKGCLNCQCVEYLSQHYFFMAGIWGQFIIRSVQHTFIILNDLHDTQKCLQTENGPQYQSITWIFTDHIYSYQFIKLFD